MTREMLNLFTGLESEELNTDVDAVNLAAQLLAELPPNDIETKILSNWILLARNDKNSITEAMSGFHALEGLNSDASLTGVCAGLVLQKKSQARNQLKRLANVKWTSQNFAEIEKGMMKFVYSEHQNLLIHSVNSYILHAIQY